MFCCKNRNNLNARARGATTQGTIWKARDRGRTGDFSYFLSGLRGRAFKCAVGSLPSRESGCFMPASKPRKRVFRFPLRRPKKSENRPDCAACACRAKPGWDVYAVDLEDGEILLFRSNESLERAQKSQANLEPGYRDHVLIVWPHGLHTVSRWHGGRVDGTQVSAGGPSHLGR